ncbi:MAG: hydantoinase/oxoprolinase family protein [Candidatus Methylomirabilia bacterium]
MQWIGVDVGGTFTDAVVYDEVTGELRWGKAASTPADPTHGVLNVLEKLGAGLVEAGRIVHGMTIGTNAILERKGVPVWVLTTRGFRDTLEIARTNRTALYNIKTLKPAPLVPGERVLEVDERVLFDGTVLCPLGEGEVRAAVDGIAAHGVGALAICFLHSYANPAHEQAAAKVAQEVLPSWFVCTSSEVLPEFREYERFSTAVLNAYIGPSVGKYLDSLHGALARRGYGRQVLIMTSSGGVVTAQRAALFPVHTVLSGPAGGVAAAVYLGQALGVENLITYDMGGTSTDVCLIERLEVPVTTEQYIAEYPNRTPQIEIKSVGAGGGSLAWLDAGGVLKVGPRSAGADPGPACYGRGGREPTVTDANLLLHRLNPRARLAGEIALDEELARQAMWQLNERLRGLDEDRLAEGIIRIAVARMVSAIKEISIAKGYDPRDFVLLAYGGAGPMHAALIADELEIPRVLVPPSPGNFSAFGSLVLDLRRDYIRTRLLETRRAPFSDVAGTFADMEEEGRAALLEEGISPNDIVTRRVLGMRYVGQSWELLVRVPDALDSMTALEEVFHRAHERRYGHSSREAAQIVSFRLAAIGLASKPTLPRWAARGALEDARQQMRSVYFDGAFRPVPVYDRDHLPAGVRVLGPAIVEEMGAVTLLPPGWVGSVGTLAELVLERGER